MSCVLNKNTINEEIKMISSNSKVSNINVHNHIFSLEYHFITMKENMKIAFLSVSLSKNMEDNKPFVAKILSNLLKININIKTILDTYLNDFYWIDGGVLLCDFLLKFDAEITDRIAIKISEKEDYINQANNSTREFETKRLMINTNIDIEDEDNLKTLINEENYKIIIFLIHALSLFVKFLIGNYGYSGQNDPPKFGDFEAQRHWMEVTTNINISDWYTNSEINPSNYWPIDYPPLSAYFAYFWGNIFKIIIPSSVELITSRGYESYMFVKMMRLSVLCSDFIFFHLPLHFLLNTFYFNRTTRNTNYNKVKLIICSILVLFNPVILLIDHGHFQYNTVMLGFFVLSLAFLLRKKFVLSIVFITFSVNFKQMGAYFALPYALYCLKYTFKQNTLLNSIFKFIVYTFVLIFTLIIIWLPWLITNKHGDVMSRIFPLWRGIFEDKVATFWCTINIISKLNTFDQNYLIMGSLVLTLLFSVPSLCLLIKKSKVNTFLSIFIVSISFFMFSFHVHEKTIMLPALAMMFCYEDMIPILPSFILLTTFSIYPLLARENQEIPYSIIITIMFMFSKYVQRNYSNLQKLICREKKEKFRPNECIIPPICSFLDYFNLLFIICYHALEHFIPPPIKLPYLYPTINAVYCFVWFFIAYFGGIINILCYSAFSED